MKRSLISKAALGILCAATVALPSCSGGDQEADARAAAAQQTPKISVETVGPGSIDLSKSYPATIKGKTDIEIRPQVSGFITQVLVDEGQPVKKGQTLFVLDQVQFQAAVDQANAAIQQANAAVAAAQTTANSAKMTADQKQALFDKNIISEYENQLAKNDLANAQSNLASARATLATANAALVNARKNLAYTVVTAPSDGVVGSIPFREGSLASPSMVTPLTTVSDNDEVYAYFSLNEKDVLDLTNGGETTIQEAIAAMPDVQLQLANGTIFPESGKVATVSGVIGTGTGATTVRALFPNLNGMLRSGSSGNVVFPVSSEGAIVIPQKATFEIQGERFVYIVDENNQLQSTRITVDKVNDGKNFIVTSGLKPGDVIAVEGVGVKLQPGMQIDPVTPEELAAIAQQQQQQQQQQH